MMKKLMSVVFALAVGAGFVAMTTGCQKEEPIKVEKHEEVNTEETMSSRPVVK